jgi:STE24 endopeptidase
MSEMTATRTVTRVATLFLFAGVGFLAARGLWATEVPDDLELPRVAAHDYFEPRELARAARHETFLRVDLLLALLAQLAALAAVAWRAAAIERRLPGPALVRGLLLGLIAFAAAWVARLPFGLAAHWWERRYGLAVRSYPEWLWHRLPGLGQVAFLCVGVAAAMLLGRALGRRWWVAAAPLAVVAAMAAVLLQPLLGPRLRPVARSDVRADLRVLAGDVRVGVERASRRTRRANAEAIGLGPTRRIALWDTLLDGRFARVEIRVVAAHEVAHVERGHAWKGLGWFALFAFPCALMVARAAERRGGPARPHAVPVLLLAVAALQVASLPVVSALTRRYEAEADWLALEATRNPDAARTLFQRFARVNVAEPDPPTWAFVLFSDHPTLLQRIAMAEAFAARTALAGGNEGSAATPGDSRVSRSRRETPGGS